MKCSKNNSYSKHSCKTFLCMTYMKQLLYFLVGYLCQSFSLFAHASCIINKSHMVVAYVSVLGEENK